MKKLLDWLPILLLALGMATGAVCWAAAEHQNIRDDCDKQTQRAEDTLESRLDRIESKIDWIISRIVD